MEWKNMKDDFKDKIKALTKSYVAKLPTKIENIETAWMRTKQSQDKESLTELINEAHALCGSAGTYGHMLISEVARKLELTCRNIQVQGITDQMKSDVDDFILDMKQLALNPPEADIESTHAIETSTQETFRVIYILEHQKNEADFKAIQEFDYDVTIFHEVNDFLQAVHKHHPDMVIINVDYASQFPLESIKKMREDLVLLVYTSSHDELMDRLLAIRHGGQAFVVRPFEINTLLRIVDDLFEAKRMLNERILIVDDSDALADYYTIMLEQSGLICKKVTDPQHFLSTLQEFQPDLILMDINMPFCSGSELAQIVHQQENLSGIPIIYLSSISEKSKQLEVLSFAGDDFLTKPVPPKDLLASIRNRLMRSRMIRLRMMRDSLTNLYNHTMIHHQLEREIMVASRYHRNVSVILIDIDHFKSVNDKHGHQAGDKILKDLSLFMQRSLRKSDLIGRYGGEEFLIVLPNTGRDKALKLANELRESFANRSHVLGNKQLFITLSGGISCYPATASASQLIKAADEALYQAKEAGRNRIVCAK
jgi:diguanylate cyclase (GGDEF)-like protein